MKLKKEDIIKLKNYKHYEKLVKKSEGKGKIFTIKMGFGFTY